MRAAHAGWNPYRPIFIAGSKLPLDWAVRLPNVGTVNRLYTGSVRTLTIRQIRTNGLAAIAAHPLSIIGQPIIIER